MENRTKNYTELIEEYQSQNIPYSALLETFEWKSVRNLILKKYNYTCQKCFKKEAKPAWEYLQNQNLRVGIFLDDEGQYQFSEVRIFDIHHKYYIKNRLPWEYDNDAYLPVCRPCHLKLHEILEIKTFHSVKDGEVLETIQCQSCNGIGYQSANHREFQVYCPHCEGKGYQEVR